MNDNISVPALDDLLDLLVEHEGSVKDSGRHVLYYDSVGVPTIGYGRNLRDRGISEDEAQILLEWDVDDCYNSLVKSFPVTRYLSEVRQAALTDMTFNLGLFGISQFVNMWEAVENGNYEVAADEMLRSRWAEQVGTRANDLATMMRDNMFPYWME